MSSSSPFNQVGLAVAQPAHLEGSFVHTNSSNTNGLWSDPVGPPHGAALGYRRLHFAHSHSTPNSISESGAAGGIPKYGCVVPRHTQQPAGAPSGGGRRVAPLTLPHLRTQGESDSARKKRRMEVTVERLLLQGVARGRIAGDTGVNTR